MPKSSPKDNGRARQTFGMTSGPRRLPGAGQVAPSGKGRSEFFSRLSPPMTNGTGKTLATKAADAEKAKADRAKSKGFGR
jgi:hypothetical protein